MHITKTKFEEICKKYDDFILTEGDAMGALEFTRELLEAEAEATKEAEPDATASIDRLREAAYEVYTMCNEVDFDGFGEG